ncbi:MAG: permease [Desulfovibrio sp.]|nr:MAG: permease [Desulfovibrio sp.]
METLSLFASLVAAIVVEAAPFLLLGSLVSACMEEWLTPERITRLVPKHPVLGSLFGLVAGMALPTCECGVVPIVRRMLLKGVPPHTAITYMLAAPVINPVVLVSTYVAFQADLSMVALRALFVAVPALAVGLALGRLRAEHLLKPARNNNEEHVHHGCACHGHDHDHADHDHSKHGHEDRPVFIRILAHAGIEFLEMGQYLVLGAVAAATIKTFMPSTWLFEVGGNMVLSVLFMMLLAVALSICSEADAFVAASFTLFSKAAKLSFVAVGPMVDIKLGAMFLGVFRRPVAVALMIAPFVMVLLLSLFYGLFVEAG